MKEFVIQQTSYKKLCQLVAGLWGVDGAATAAPPAQWLEFAIGMAMAMAIALILAFASAFGFASMAAFAVASTPAQEPTMNDTTHSAARAVAAALALGLFAPGPAHANGSAADARKV